MKTMMLFAFLLVFSAPLFACDDPPVPVTISGTRFEDEELEVSATGIRFSGGLIQYDLTARAWCFKTPDALANCKLKDLKFIGKAGPDKGKVVGEFRFVGRSVYLYQNRTANDALSFQADEDVPHFVFSDASANPYSFYGSDRLSTRVADKTGILGQLNCTRIRSAKQLPLLSKNPRLDLRRVEIYISGCGGVARDVAEVVNGKNQFRQPDQQFEPSINQPPPGADTKVTFRHPRNSLGNY